MNTHNQNNQNQDGEPIRTVVARIDENVKTLVASSSDHEARIRKLEQWQWKMLGAGALVSIALAAYEALHR